MYLDDFIPRHDLRPDDPSPSDDIDAQWSVRHLLRVLWSGVRQVAWGIDAFSSVWHGIDVPPDHGARSRPRQASRRP